jgi:hypothetical protein
MVEKIGCGNEASISDLEAGFPGIQLDVSAPDGAHEYKAVLRT